MGPVEIVDTVDIVLDLDSLTKFTIGHTAGEVNDQITNADQIVRLGLGKRVRSFPSRGKELFKAVSEVYSDGAYKERANAVKEVISKQNGWDDVIGRIEALFEKEQLI